MTDIEFDQIREGQTVRVHYTYENTSIQATVEGPVESVDSAGGRLRPRRPDDLRFGAGLLTRALPREAQITRVELLEDVKPASQWEAGQLAEITYDGDGERHTALAGRRAGPAFYTDGWYLLSSGDFVHDDEVVGEPRLLKPLPAGWLQQRAMYLPPYAATPSPLAPVTAARSGGRTTASASACRIRTEAADAIEEAQQ